MTQFKDKVAIVTGGGRDIGREISLKLAAAGAKVCINYANDEASAQETLKQVEAAGGTAIVHRRDPGRVRPADRRAGERRRWHGPAPSAGRDR